MGKMVVISKRIIVRLFLVFIYLLFMRLIAGKWTEHFAIIGIFVIGATLVEEVLRYVIGRRKNRQLGSPKEPLN
jgi:cytochrome b